MNKIKGMTIAMGMLAVVGCATKQGTGSLIGGGGGAIIGGIIGKLAGNTAVGAAIGGAVGAGAGAIIGHHMDKVAEQAKQIENAKVEKVTDKNGLEAVKVTFDSGILFATNKSDLNANSKNDLAKFSTVLKNNSDCHIDVFGHTDSSGNDAINVPLRNVQGKGSSEPVADNTTAAGKQQNRRVEVYLYASQAMVDAANAGTLK